MPAAAAAWTTDAIIQFLTSEWNQFPTFKNVSCFRWEFKTLCWASFNIWHKQHNSFIIQTNKQKFPSTIIYNKSISFILIKSFEIEFSSFIFSLCKVGSIFDTFEEWKVAQTLKFNMNTKIRSRSLMMSRSTRKKTLFESPNSPVRVS